MKTLRIIAIGLFITMPTAAQQTGIKRTELQRHDLSVPGRETVQSRIDFAPGAAFPRHTHPGEEIIYVRKASWSIRSTGSRR